MTAKQSLGARIRGWLPESPKELKLSFIPDFIAKNPRPQKNPKVPSKQVSLQSIVFALIMTFNFVILLFNQSFHIYRLSFDSFVPFVIVGVVVGGFVAILPAYTVLDKLSKGRKTYANLSELSFFAFLLLLMGLMILELMGFNNVDIYAPRQYTEFQKFVPIFCLSSAIAVINARLLLFVVWERKNHCKILVNKRLNLFIVPKSGQNSNFSQCDKNSEN